MTTIGWLETFFNSDIDFVGIKLTIPNAPGYEVIINPRENFKEKLAYYKKTYDENGVHKHVPEIKIISWSCGNTFQQVQDGFDLILRI